MITSHTTALRAYRQPAPMSPPRDPRPLRTLLDAGPTRHARTQALKAVHDYLQNHRLSSPDGTIELLYGKGETRPQRPGIIAHRWDASPDLVRPRLLGTVPCGSQTVYVGAESPELLFVHMAAQQGAPRTTGSSRHDGASAEARMAPQAKVAAQPHAADKRTASAKVAAQPRAAGEKTAHPAKVAAQPRTADEKAITEALSIARAAALGCELCGRYALAYPSGPCPEAAARGFIDREEPLTSVDRLTALLSQLPHGARGSRTARQALPFVGENARSPQETAVFLCLTLPPRLGGFGLTPPQLNAPFELSGTGASLLRSPFLWLDLYWADARLAVEYDSRLTHFGEHNASQAERDLLRTNELERRGQRVYRLTAPEVMDPTRFRINAQNIASLLGCRPRLVDGFDERYRELHSLLFGSELTPMSAYEDKSAGIDGPRR